MSPDGGKLHNATFLCAITTLKVMIKPKHVAVDTVCIILGVKITTVLSECGTDNTHNTQFTQTILLVGYIITNVVALLDM